MFNKGDTVIVKHQTELGECIVVDPHDPTDMVRVGNGPSKPGKPVVFYVRIDTPKGKAQGYHEESLEKL